MVVSVANGSNAQVTQFWVAEMAPPSRVPAFHTFPQRTMRRRHGDKKKTVINVSSIEGGTRVNEHHMCKCCFRRSPIGSGHEGLLGSGYIEFTANHQTVRTYDRGPIIRFDSFFSSSSHF